MRNVIDELGDVINGKNSGSIVPHLRSAYRSLTTSAVRESAGSANLRIAGELYGLLTNNTNLIPEEESMRIRTLLTCLIRELVCEVPSFFADRLSTYSPESVQYMMRLMRELNSRKNLPTRPPNDNSAFLIDVFSDIDNPVPLRLEALTMLLRTGGLAANTALDLVIADMLVIPVTADFDKPTQRKSLRKKGNALLRMVSSIGRRPLISPRSTRPNPLELDGSGSPTDEIFSVLVHAKNFSDDQLMHTGLMTCLYPFLKQRLTVCEAPPNTPATNSAAASPAHAASTYSSEGWGLQSRRVLIDSVVAVCVRILTQAQKEISLSVFEGRKSWKFFPSSLDTWTREFVESTIVETIRCLDLVCRRDVAVVSSVFPHVRKTYERVLQREDSPGIALTETLKFFISHSYLVIFDLEPVLRYFFEHHVSSRLMSHNLSSCLAVETVVFLNQFAPQLCGSYSSIISEYMIPLLRLAAWYPRTVGVELVDFFSHATLDDPAKVFHGILDIPLMAAMNELTLSIDAYIRDPAEGGEPSEDPFATARTAMRLIRSVEFKEISDYMLRGNRDWIQSGKSVTLLTEMWKGIPVTPRVAAASKLVPRFLSVVTETSISAILSRFGSGKIFLFKSKEIGSVLLGFLADAFKDEVRLSAHKDDIVTAIIERVLAGQDMLDSESLVIALVDHISCITSSDSLPLFMRTLRWLLGHPDLPQAHLDIVCIRNGRIVMKPSDRHVLLDQVVDQPVSLSTELVCVVIATLTKLAVRFPQYRPQTVVLFESIEGQIALIPRERINESLNVLNSFSVSRELLGLGA